MKVEELVSRLSKLEPGLELVFFDGTVPRALEAVKKTRVPGGERVVLWLKED